MPLLYHTCGIIESMKKMNTTPLSGTQEFSPAVQAVFNDLKAKIAAVYRLHGFETIETPVLERLDILLAKAGGDTEKQIYRVLKTGETGETADQGLRFDHTVPLARYVVEHENELIFPFKVSQIGRNWRGERAQKGRFREFYQCDVDVIGRGTLDIAYDAEVIATLLDAYSRLKLTTPVVARISNRKIVTGFLSALDLTAQAGEIYSIIDHADKMSPEAVEQALRDLQLPNDGAKKVLQLMAIHGARAAVMEALGALNIDNEEFAAGVAELGRVLELLEADGLEGQIEANLRIVRGLDYYTGTVFEFAMPEHTEVGSLGGGGRYENLAGYFTDQQLPGVGGSIGLSRLFYLLNEYHLLAGSSAAAKAVEYAVIPMSEAQAAFALKIARKLRSDNSSATVVFAGKRLGDKLTYASKLARKAIVIGEEEVASGQYTVKQFD